MGAITDDKLYYLNRLFVHVNRKIDQYWTLEKPYGKPKA